VVRRFLGSFELIFASFVGDYINIRKLPPQQKKQKLAQKNPKSDEPLVMQEV
jgi:hypothetical protein